ncbi:LysR family transcriptional regulator [Microvirga pakistanensis]|uniref:LysR family transcriptional regulator n=1 Tax=Microvirga pakistanensis TaxID=1682650 RepID=UPI00141AE981|nr:LysR family transcriptional regulator [Microvirga pakistanensis]
MLDEIRTFVLLSEEGSIQRVAERVRLTQPAVTRQIQRLEHALGVELLDRRLKPPRLTPAGAEALARCRQILSAYADMRRIGVRGEPEGLLRVGITHGLADDRLAAIVSSLRETFPRVVLQLTAGWSDRLAENLQRGMLDVAYILSGSPERASLSDSTTLGQEPLAIIASSDLANAREYNTAAIASHPWILNPEPCDARHRLAKALAPYSRCLTVAAEVQDARLQIALVREGVGFSLMPQRQLRSGLPDGIAKVGIPDLNLILAIEVQRSPHLANLKLVEDALTARFAAMICDQEASP